MNARRAPAAWRLAVTGRVQGVGFRPFVYRLAHTHRLSGFVLNAGGQVDIHVEGPAAALAAFRRELLARAPPLARPRLGAEQAVPAAGFTAFTIESSRPGRKPEIHVPPDQFACADCLAEMSDPGERRYRYPFINCTQCGPRYTIIRALPYDRPNTTLAGFPLCAACAAEYREPLDRRFHAQPLACPVCGPHLVFVPSPPADRSPAGNQSSSISTPTAGREPASISSPLPQAAEGTGAGAIAIDGDEAALAAGVQAILAGQIVAVRGIGGYHLICDAAHEAAVRRLRQRKRRPNKPLAVMVPLAGKDGVSAARRLAALSPGQAQMLADPMRPIVLAPLQPGAGLAAGIAPGLGEIGLMLPYSPLHHLLLAACGRPLVATSGNISGEPVLTTPADAETRLREVADAFVHHNRPIERPADDPVYREIAGVLRPLRLGRGNAPLEMDLPFKLNHPVLAAGAFMKNTVALAWDDRLIVSPHIGELETPRARAVFGQVVEDLQRLYGIRALAVVCDAHPDFPNSRWARDSGLAVTPVFHHHAHAAALAGEFKIDKAILVFTWDGVGYGADGTLWGGEALLGRPGAWRRFASLLPFRLPGGEQAVRQPWRTALSLAWTAGTPWPAAPPAPDLLHRAWQRGINSPLTSAAGRLFDGAAALAGLVGEASYDGQGPMELEAASTGADVTPIILPLNADDQNVQRLDWRPLVSVLSNPALPAAERGAIFHESLAAALAAQAHAARTACGIDTVGLTGGVFQNRRLTDSAARRLRELGFNVLIPERLPLNDAGISYGQIVEYAFQNSSLYKL